MRDPKRIPDVLATLGQYWRKFPDLRLGQILSNFAGYNGSFFEANQDPYYLEDDVLLERMKEELRKMRG